MVTITDRQLSDILYHLDGFLRLMGYGKEHSKICLLVCSLPLDNVDLSKFYHVQRVWKDRELYRKASDYDY